MRTHHGSSGNHADDSFATSAATLAFAQRRSASGTCFDSIQSPSLSRFFAASVQSADQAGASDLIGGDVRAQQKGSVFRIHRALSFVPDQWGTQWRMRLSLAIEGPSMEMKQGSLALYARMEGPGVCTTAEVAMCKTYRDAVRHCWGRRRVHGMTQRQLAIEAGLRPQLVSDYLHRDDKPGRKSLPADRIAAFESITGNTLLTQWLAARQSLTILEETIANNMQKVAA